MAAKMILAFCAQALLIQSALSQCAAGIGAPYGLAGPGKAGPSLAGPGLVGPGLAGPYGGCGCGGVSSSGGGFPVTSISPFAPTGISIISENNIEGSLNVGGSLPFLGTVILDGVLPSSGTGAVSYGCGNEDIGIVTEGPINTGIVGPTPYGPVGPAPYGPVGPAPYVPVGPAPYGPSLLSAPLNGLAGCGCNGVY